MKAGIVGFGGYIPRFRIRTEEIAEIWSQNPETIKKGLLIEEKSVPGKDEDTATISVQAAQNALKRAQIPAQKIAAIYVGSESHPYAVKPTASIVGQAIGAGNDYMAVDTEFACKAGTACLQICLALVESGLADYGLAIGADTSQSAPGNALEYSASAGGAAFIVGREKKEIVAEIKKTLSFSTDTPDFWRRGLQPYPAHAGRFTGQPAYFRHVVSATKNILEATNSQPEDFDFVVFHQPNGKFPLRAAKTLGFKKEQLEPGLLVRWIGNTYSGSSMLGLAAVLDKAVAGQRILVTSYGSGSGSDAFILETTKNIEEKKPLAKSIEVYLARKEYLSYARYRKHMELIH